MRIIRADTGTMADKSRRVRFPAVLNIEHVPFLSQQGRPKTAPLVAVTAEAGTCSEIRWKPLRRDSASCAVGEIVVAALGLVLQAAIQDRIEARAAFPRKAGRHALVLQALPLFGRLENLDGAPDAVA